MALARRAISNHSSHAYPSSAVVQNKVCCPVMTNAVMCSETCYDVQIHSASLQHCGGNKTGEKNAKLHHILLPMCRKAHCFIHGWQECRWTTGCLWHPELSLSRICTQDLHHCLLSVPLIKMRFVSSLPEDTRRAYPCLNLSVTIVAGSAGYSIKTIMKLTPIFPLIAWY